MDLISWAAKWDKNSNRPYFEGHERSDVVDARKEFVAYFLTNRHLYYSTERDEKRCPFFKIPDSTGERRILLAHDESTYRSGEIPKSRWLFPGSAPFFNK